MHASLSSHTPTSGYLSGQLLVATPLVGSPGFSRAVIFVCAHDASGAMGIIINHIIENISYKELFEQLSITQSEATSVLPVHYGGPVEINRGFVIYHLGDDAAPADTLITVDKIAISSSLQVLRQIGEGQGPRDRILALGYAGWGPGQLESEIEANSWLTVPAHRSLIFDTKNEVKWESAANSQGINIHKLTSIAGHA